MTEPGVASSDAGNIRTENRRIVRITDGPDEVHCRQIAQLELAKHLDKTDADVKAYS